MAVAHATSPNPRLPLELEHTIFEISALSWPCRIPNLMLVAHRVKAWVEPLMYRVIFLSAAHSTLEGFPTFNYDVLSRLLVSEPPDFFKKSVRHLFLGNRWSSSGVAPDAFLRACTDVVDLFDFRGSRMAALDSLHSVQRIALDTSALFPAASPTNFSHSLFHHVTHLEIIDTAKHQNLAGIPHIPHLTHFAFNDPDLCAFLASSVVPLCPRLQCIVLLVRTVWAAIAPLVDDKRFVPMNQLRWTLDWQRGTSGGMCYWDVADAFVRARHSGRVKKITAFISSEDASWF